ncbi:MAG: hemerythrin domain-containing protein [Deltaproteobacteria bacterium]|nr:hemerythrin domain-containing protein [Deltaproteobacteria bacterium]
MKLEIKYRCMQGSCCVNCREGVIALDESLFNELKAVYEDKELFRSPKGLCRLGFSQPFKVMRMVQLNDQGEVIEEGAQVDENDPIGILVAEHKDIMKKFDEIDEQIKRRDIDALWISTCELANSIYLHSGLKEEEVLFPAMRDVLALGESLTSIIKEEHREVMSLLSNFRTALEEDNIMDSIITSMIVSLKGHIRKEDQEFFELVDKCLDKAMRKDLVDGMKKIETTFVPAPVGERRRRSNEERDVFDDNILAIKELTNAGCCH